MTTAANVPEFMQRYLSSERRRLVVDDVREFEGAFHAKNCAEAIGLIANGDWEEIALDHDLGDETVMPVVKYLASLSRVLGRCPDIDIRVITMNPAGQRAIVAALRGLYNRIIIDPAGHMLRTELQSGVHPKTATEGEVN